MRRFDQRSATLLGFAFVAAAISSPAQTTFTSLFSFNGADGANPDFGAVVQGNDGNFYGTTTNGGAAGAGTVFKITTGGTLTTLYSFCSRAGCSDGSNPFGGLVQAADGNFYGTTKTGGANGDGTVFKITPGGTLTTLHSFDGTDGERPRTALLQAKDGNFYGTTSYGGNNGVGTVFQITSAGVLATLYSFCSQVNCTDGASPFAPLIQGTDGNFYGTTSSGGAITQECSSAGLGQGCGTVFKVTSGGTLTTLYTFCSQTNCTDGGFPIAGVTQGSDENFYGSTVLGGSNSNCTEGCGTVFKLITNGTLTTLHSFAEADGYSPAGQLLQATDGNFYGTTAGCGADGNCTYGSGTIFRISSAGALTTLHSFSGTDGSNPFAGLVQAKAINGTFYGTTSYGGSSNAGTVFSLSVDLGRPLSLGLHLDFDGYGAGTDYAVWRPSNGTWYVLPTSGGTSITKPWGESGDIIVPGDYDGDGKTDYAIWRPSNGTWYVILSSTGKSISYVWGESTDVPVPGDYDGDGKTDYAVWRPSNGTFYVVLSSTGKSTSKQWGVSTDLPVVGDFDGDGKTDYAVWRPSNGTWYVVLSSTGKSTSYAWGESTDIPVTGDYDGDGKTDYAVWRPSNGTFYVVLSSTGKSTSKQWGKSGDVPVPRDYDGDNKTDYAVWRPSNGTWYVVDSSTGKTISVQWGLSTDVPVNNPTGE